MIPCEIGCSPSSGSGTTTTALPPLQWDFSRTPCVSDIAAVMPSRQAVVVLEKGGSQSAVYLTVGIVGGLVIFLAGLAWCTLQRRRAVAAEG